jgi:hypothetical protein
VEQPFAMPKAAGMQFLVRFGNSPGGASLSGTRGLLTTIRRGERALLIDEFDDLSNDHIITFSATAESITLKAFEGVTGVLSVIPCARWKRLPIGHPKEVERLIRLRPASARQGC